MVLMAFVVPITTIAEPKPKSEYPTLVQEIVEPVVEEVKPKPMLSYDILSNCYAYVKSVYPNTPGTVHIQANLSDSGEIGVFYYASSGLWHYVVVESVDGDMITFSETNYQGHKKSTRTMPRASFVGFYDL